MEIVKAELPSYNILSEEEGETKNNSDYTIVIDPLDGTNNFVLSIPDFSVSIALLHKGEAVAGVVYQPITDQTFTAIKARGAWLNGKEIKVNGVTDPRKLSIIYLCSYKWNSDYLGRVMGSLYGSECKRIINNWSAAFEHCMLAVGKVESIINEGTEIHDYTAGKLIAMEAGARVIDFSGQKEKDYTNDKFIISNTSEVNNYILNIIKPLQKS